MDIGSIDDGISHINFRNDPSTEEITKWTYLLEPNLIRGDFAPEPIWNINNGILDGKMPPREDESKIIGYAPQDDCYPWYAQVTGQQISDRQYKLTYTPVNEFYGCITCNQPNTYLSFIVTITITYTLDGAGNIQADIEVQVNGGDIPAVIQNIHFAELQVYNSVQFGTGLGNFYYEYDRWTPIDGWRFVVLDAAQVFGNLNGISSYYLHDANPKTQPPYLVNQAFQLPTCENTWYFQDQVTLSPRIIGFSRKADGKGFLAVHGVLPSNSQPLHLGFYGPGEGIVPIVTQFAYLGYANRTITKFTMHFLPMNGSNNDAQRNYALSLAGYNNPTAVIPF